MVIGTIGGVVNKEIRWKGIGPRRGGGVQREINRFPKNVHAFFKYFQYFRRGSLNPETETC